MAVGSKLVGIGTGLVVRKVSDALISKAWKKTKHSDPPTDPASPGTPWAEAVSWAVASGVAMAVGRLLATRGTATAKMKITGKVPEGMEPPQPKGLAGTLRRS
ncbi:MAG: hypothetical protein JWN08_223 [Frankiales bacterium]|nr:hypothetical protein [Frankiales bacterium]